MPGSRALARGREFQEELDKSWDWDTDSDESDEREGSSCGSPTSASGGAKVPCVAQAIYNLRWFFLLGWPALAVALAPCAYMLLLNAAPMTKRAPEGTESTAAMEVFQKHFPDLAEVRREMVVIRCRTQCDTAASDLSRGMVEQVSDMVYRFGGDNPDADVVVNSYFTFSEHHQLGDNPMISGDKQSILLLWVWRVPEALKKGCENFVTRVQQEIDEMNEMQPADGLSVSLTGLVTLDLGLTEIRIQMLSGSVMARTHINLER